MPVSPDLSVFGKNQGFSDYQRANEEFAQRKALQQAQIQLSQAQAEKALKPEEITPYQAASLDLQKQALDQKLRPEPITPYQAAMLEMQRRRLELSMAKGGSYVDENGDIIQGQPPAKILPQGLTQGVLENRLNLKKAETALDLMSGKTVEMGGQTIQGDKNATGWKGYLPGPVLNRIDAAGVPTRAAVADIGSLVLHDRSGAVITAAEYPRLAPFIPQATDDKKTAETKMRNFVATYKNLVDSGELFLKETGYRVPDRASSAPGATPNTPATGKWTIEAVD